MKLYPEGLLETLEFNRIRELTAERCAGPVAADAALTLLPGRDLPSIRRALAETDEASRTFEGPEPMPFGAYADIRDTFRLLEIADYVLDPEDLLQYRVLLRIHAGLHQWMTDERARIYPVLGEWVRGLAFESLPLVSLDRVFDDKGDVVDDASPALRQIRRNMAARQAEMDRQFGALVQEYRKQGWLTESGESIRNGRRVLTVPVEHKRKIKGIIHDESASGRTVFLEPERMVELNNELFDLESEERQEILRILRQLCHELRVFLPYFRELFRFVSRFDLVRAKALVGRMYGGQCPDMVEQPEVTLRKARHPLLVIRFKEQGKTVVPYDLTLDRRHRILVLSGPNAGGKSITMKSVMLLQIMVQTGFLVPVGPGSRFPVFHKFFADIGDQQSLEDDLSTYSSRLRNMQVFLRDADRRTLLALDEFGSGTDPQIGGAIAEACLKALNKKQVMGIVTTHYSQLKLFAHRQPGIINGAMIFDQEHLQPSYVLRVGQPGSSYAFEIAASSGLPAEVIREAQSKSGDHSRDLERLLVQLQQERLELEGRLEHTRQREVRLDQLIRNYEAMFGELEYQRKRLKVEAKEVALQQKSREAQEIEQLFRELKEERRLEKVQERRDQLKREQERLREQVASERQEAVLLAPEAAGGGVEPVRVGGYVRVRGGGAIGQVLAIEKRKARIALGEMTVVVDLRELEGVQEPLEAKTARTVTLRDEPGGPSTRLDIRGFKKEEALRVLELFLDQALLQSTRSVRILHGLGTGALRRTVWEKAREYKDIRSIEPAAPEDGGEGVTILRFG